MGDHRPIISRTAMYRLSTLFKKELFENDRYRFDDKSMMTLLDIISKDDRAPNQNKIPYGQAIRGINNIRDLLHKMGVWGTYYRLQAKQAITCGVIDKDDNGVIQNQKLLRILLPHKSDSARKEWIKKCASYLDSYDKGDSDTIFDKYLNVQRNS